MSTKKIITVIGATGGQGGAIVETFLSDAKLKQEWTVRGVTRDATKESAKKLAEKGVEVVSANVDDKASLVKAFAGSHTVFGVTNYWEKMDAALETQQGNNIADAAKEAGVQHFIWSSLLDVNKLTGGKLSKVYHFDSKAKTEEYTRSLGIPATFFMPGLYLSNIDGSFQPAPPNNAWTFGLPSPADAPIPFFWAGDTGKYVKAIVLRRESLLGERVHAATYYRTPQDVVDAFKKTFPEAGKDASYYPLSHEMFMGYMTGTVGMPEFAAEELLQNFRLLSEGGYFGGASLEHTHKLVESVGEKLTTIEEYFKISKTFKELK